MFVLKRLVITVFATDIYELPVFALSSSYIVYVLCFHFALADSGNVNLTVYNQCLHTIHTSVLPSIVALNSAMRFSFIHLGYTEIWSINCVIFVVRIIFVPTEINPK
jgi:hypothetical protein